jgi:hypothetical protein
VVKYLLHKGVDPTIKAANGKTAMEVASTSDIANVIKQKILSPQKPTKVPTTSGNKKSKSL